MRAEKETAAVMVTSEVVAAGAGLVAFRSLNIGILYSRFLGKQVLYTLLLLAPRKRRPGAKQIPISIGGLPVLVSATAREGEKP